MTTTNNIQVQNNRRKSLVQCDACGSFFFPPGTEMPFPKDEVHALDDTPRVTSGTEPLITMEAESFDPKIEKEESLKNLETNNTTLEPLTRKERPTSTGDSGVPAVRSFPVPQDTTEYKKALDNAYRKGAEAAWAAEAARQWSLVVTVAAAVAKQMRQ